MNVAKLLEKRRVQWSELEMLCESMDTRGRTSGTRIANHSGAAGVTRFATLYRAACADLALADAYQLPPGTVTYLHRLVARAHSQLYRAEQFKSSTWLEFLFDEAPKQIFRDPCVRVATVVFFGLFALTMYLGYNEAMFPNFASNAVGDAQLSGVEEMYSQPVVGSLDHYVGMAAFYIRHNTSIGLRCFAFGILLIPCVIELVYNAVTLGTIFGYMARPDVAGSENFFHFVTAHGPFELTAIALAGGAGLRLGMGVFNRRGLRMLDSIRANAMRSVPIMAASAILFFLAALTEGFLSPSPAPYLVKATCAIVSSGMISFYFVILGFPRDAGIRMDVVRRGRSDSGQQPAGPFDAA